jgi:putative glutamine amidotransferase
VEEKGDPVDKKPLIAVTGPDSRFPVAWWAAALAIHWCGGRALRLTPGNFHQHKKELLEGVVIGGGSDIDPGLYGGADDGISQLDPQRDAFEIEIIKHALHTNLPILGICRGAQLINVVLGGTLFRDIRTLRKQTSNRRTPLPRKTAILEQDCMLYKLHGRRRVRINSLHHQAIEKTGAHLKVVARDLDDFVQAIESTEHRFLLGTQWHPEYLWWMRLHRRVFQELVDEASRCRSERLYA